MILRKTVRISFNPWSKACAECPFHAGGDPQAYCKMKLGKHRAYKCYPAGRCPGAGEYILTLERATPEVSIER